MAVFDFTQGSSSDTWVVNHALNTKSIIVGVFIDNGGVIQKTDPVSVTQTDDDNVTITLASAEIGHVHIIGGELA